jgi:hypothetical protein
VQVAGNGVRRLALPHARHERSHTLAAGRLHPVEIAEAFRA